MTALMRRAILVLTVLALVAVTWGPVTAAPRFSKTVTPMEDGLFMVKIRMTASANDIYALKLVDPESAIVDIFAPRGWVALTDGEEFLARSGKALDSGKSVEFILHTSSDRVAYTWAVFGKLEQIGTPGSL